MIESVYLFLFPLKTFQCSFFVIINFSFELLDALIVLKDTHVEAVYGWLLEIYSFVAGDPDETVQLGESCLDNAVFLQSGTHVMLSPDLLGTWQ